MFKICISSLPFLFGVCFMYGFFLFALITNYLVWADVEILGGYQDDENAAG